MSAGISEIDIQLVQNEPSLMWSRIKWCRTSMCLERDVKEELLVSAQALWLSDNKGKGCEIGKESKESNKRIQIASLRACVNE